MQHSFPLPCRAQSPRQLRVALCAAVCILFALTGITAHTASTPSTPSTTGAKSVYDNQPPLTDKELLSFMEVLPHFRAWAIASREEAHPVIAGGKADFIYSPKAAEWVQQRGWEPRRFFCVMGRAAAALSLVADGNDAHAQRPADMPTVAPQEIALVRRHLTTLLKAGTDAPPIKR